MQCDQTRTTGQNRNPQRVQRHALGTTNYGLQQPQNLMQDALGLTSDRVYRWRLLLEEYGPTIVYIKGIHNTVADAISP